MVHGLLIKVTALVKRTCPLAHTWLRVRSSSSQLFVYEKPLVNQLTGWCLLFMCLIHLTEAVAPLYTRCCLECFQEWCCSFIYTLKNLEGKNEGAKLFYPKKVTKRDSFQFSEFSIPFCLNHIRMEKLARKNLRRLWKNTYKERPILIFLLDSKTLCPTNTSRSTWMVISRAPLFLNVVGLKL